MGLKAFILKFDKLLAFKVSEDTSPKKKLGPMADSAAFARWGGIATGIIFILLGLAYLQGDLWFDEILSFDYVMPNTVKKDGLALSGVFTRYNKANNHILFSALMWLWIRVFGIGNEAFLRLPSVAMALFTLYLVYTNGKRLFGHVAAALLLTMMMAFSPVYICFFAQFRGYSFTILLATLATIGAIEIVRDNRRRGVIMFVSGAVLLPMVMPSNLIVNAGLLLFINAVLIHRKKWLQRLPLLLLVGCASPLGLLLYVPIWDKLQRVMATTHGWESTGGLLGHLGIALVAHIGLFPIACLGLRRQKDVANLPESDASEEKSDIQRMLPWLAGSCLLTIVVVALLRRPFPRVFLGFLPAFTFAAMSFYSPKLVRINKYLYLLVFFVLSNFLVWNRIGDALTNDRRRDGIYPQNLLQQYYSRNRDVSQTVTFITREIPLPPNAVVFTDFHLYLAVRQYWMLAGMDPGRIECMKGGGSKPYRLKREREHYPYLPILILAYSREEAVNSFMETTGLEIRVEPLPSPTELTIFRVTGLVGSPSPPLDALPPQPDPGGTDAI